MNQFFIRLLLVPFHPSTFSFSLFSSASEWRERSFFFLAEDGIRIRVLQDDISRKDEVLLLPRASFDIEMRIRKGEASLSTIPSGIVYELIEAWPFKFSTCARLVPR